MSREHRPQPECPQAGVRLYNLPYCRCPVNTDLNLTVPKLESDERLQFHPPEIDIKAGGIYTSQNPPPPIWFLWMGNFTTIQATGYYVLILFLYRVNIFNKKIEGRIS